MSIFFHISFSLDVRLEQSFSLDDGPNLISYLGILEDNSIESMLAGLSNNVTQISTENSASIQQEDGSWIGGLNYIETTKAYWLRLETPDSTYAVATYETPVEQIFSLHMEMNFMIQVLLLNGMIS